MTISPAIALRKAILARLSSDSDVTKGLGGAKIYDEAPRAVEPPYVLLGDMAMRDWSTPDSSGAEHILTLVVVSNARGAGEALNLAQYVCSALNEAALPLRDHSLVDLRFVSLETRRTQDGRFARASLRFRATTQQI